MMTNLRTALLGTTAIVLALGTAPAMSQDKPSASGGVGADVQSGAQTGAQTGQGGAQGSVQGGAQGSAQGSAQTGQGGAGAEAEGSAGGSAETQARQQRSGQDRDQGETRGETRSEARSEQEGQAQGSAETQARQQRSGQNREAQGSRGSDTDVSVKFSSEHKTKVRSYFKKNRVTVDPVERASISVSVGGTVPQHITLHPLPQTIVVDLPPDAEYHYFVWGNDIVIVDARTHVVVEILYDVA
jgi:hypothetical protein